MSIGQMRLVILISIIILGAAAGGDCRSAAGVFEQLKQELQSAGVSDQFIKVAEDPVNRMITWASETADIKTVLLDLWGQGIKGRALKNALAAVAELVASGDNTLEAARIASQAAHKAELEGLSGFGVGMKVKQAVQDRKKYLRDIQQQHLSSY